MKNNKKVKAISGERIYLRRIMPNDATAAYAAWMNDKEVNRYLESRFGTWNVKKLKDYIKKINADDNCRFWAIIEKDTDRHVGNIKVGPVNRVHKIADMGIIIGEKSVWGKGYATEAIKLAKKSSFKELGLRKLTAGIYSANAGSVKAFLKAGFAIEGKQLKHYRCGGKYVDGILLGCMRIGNLKKEYA